MPRFLLCALFLLLLTGCSPSLSPLYRDYETQERNAMVATRLETALRDAGWDVVATDVPGVLATEPRTVRHWGLYKIIVSLEAAPLGGEHVRLYFHPYRRYFTGGRSKMPFLSRGLQRSLLPDLNEALEAQGLKRVGTPFERDRMARQ